jgi:Ala-tRNA(Pro) deacylase
MKQNQVYKQAIKLLENSGVQFRLIDHPPTRTAQEAAKVAGSKSEEVAKSLLLMSDKKPILVIVAGDRRIEFKTLKTLKGIKDLRMANPKEVISYTGCPIGSVPPFGQLFNLPIIVDSAIEKMDEVVFSPGTDIQSARMKAKDLLEILQGEILNFSTSA